MEVEVLETMEPPSRQQKDGRVAGWWGLIGLPQGDVVSYGSQWWNDCGERCFHGTSVMNELGSKDCKEVVEAETK